MPEPQIDADVTLRDALLDIRKIIDSVHPHAKPGEKLVRIGWVIAGLPSELRDIIVEEVRKRVIAGWTAGKKPTDW
jgi:hypothetical protein